MSAPNLGPKRYMIGKYEIIAKLFPQSAHMLCYRVFVNGRSIGAMASMPSESDCLFLEKPPVVPPLVPYQAIYRPGRPKKGTPPRTNADPLPPPREELPHGMSFPIGSEEH